MNQKKTFLLRIIVMPLLAMGFSLFLASAQEKDMEAETDPLVLKNLERFQDLKFGLMMHWGPYSQWGIVESWSICSEDEPWCRRNVDNYVEYCKKYIALKTTFNPTNFDPDKWARAAQYAGMKYVVFTTKHHDGFCMFDTKQTDYRITDAQCPFHSHPKANITKEVFDAFRKKGFGIGAYFSKPDWHSPDYWAPEWATPDRNVNYRTDRYPERWQKFCDFTFRQIEELMTEYGKVDILWLDGGWVRPRPPIVDSKGRIRKEPKDQDINMPRIAAMARSRQPGLLIVDRTVSGKYENYRTSEQHVPERPLDYAWETCMTMGESWSYKPGDSYKSAHELIHLLVDIVAKGGNFLLNIGPDSKGEFPEEAYGRLEKIGDWMKINGEAIYSTRPVSPFKETKVCLTQGKDGTIYAIYLADADEVSPPSKILLNSVRPDEGGDISMLGFKEPVKWENVGKGVLISVPEQAVKNPPCGDAWTFKIVKKKG